jgi:hypothetical protein
VIEQYADGLTDIATLRAAATNAEAAWQQDEMGFGAPVAIAAGWRLESSLLQPVHDAEPVEMLLSVVQQLAFEGRWVFSDGVRRKDSREAERDECGVLAHLVRDVFGNPSRQILIGADVPRWNDSTPQKIAQAIYDERAFDRMPILADALEDAGCDNADILRHCREPGEHVRGCWVVDLILGKK